MINPPADSADEELLDLAARLLGVHTVDLLHVVRRADGSLVVLLGTGQKYVFDPEAVAAQLARQLQERLSAAPPEPAKPARRRAA